MKTVALVLGAGTGSRMNINQNKVLLDLNGKTVIERSVEKYTSLNEVDEVIVVCREEELDSFKNILTNEKVSFVIGGETRQDSVFNAIETVDKCDYIMIHDGARPLVSKKAILDTLNIAKKTGASATGVFVKDTIKIVNENNEVVSTPNRSEMISIQTPQIFDFKIYQKAFNNAKDNNLNFTDDCQLVEAIGNKVTVSIGDYSNIKITTKDDLCVAKSLLIDR